MQDDTPTCARCNRPTAHDGARLCTPCLDGLFADLAHVDELYDDLDVTRTKQDVITREQSVRSSKQHPLGYRPGALSAADELTTCLRFWARTIADEWEQRLQREYQAVHKFTAPEDGKACARWLRTNPNTIRYSQHTADMVDQIGYAIAKARSVIDRPAERRYAGACPDCRMDLYVREEATHITCPGCARIFRSDQRYADLLAELRDRLATAAEIAAGVGRLTGNPLSRNTITQWHTRGRLVPRGHTPEGHPMYRIGDVLDLARSPKREKSRVARSPRATTVSPCTC